MSKKVAAKPPLERVSASPETGLTGKDIDERVKNGYINKATDPNQKTPLKILFTNTFTFFNCVLFTIAAIFIIFIIFLQSIGRDDIADSYFGFSKFVFLIPAVMNGDLKNFLASVLILACIVVAMPPIMPIAKASILFYLPIQLSSARWSMHL